MLTSTSRLISTPQMLFLICVTPVMHAFWLADLSEEVKLTEMVSFFKVRELSFRPLPPASTLLYLHKFYLNPVPGTKGQYFFLLCFQNVALIGALLVFMDMKGAAKKVKVA